MIGQWGGGRKRYARTHPTDDEPLETQLFAVIHHPLFTTSYNSSSFSPSHQPIITRSITALSNLQKKMYFPSPSL